MGGVGGAGIGSRKGRGPAQVGRIGAVQLYPPGVPAHNYYLIHTAHSFVPSKTFFPYITGFQAPLVPLKTFSRYKIPFYIRQWERDREKRQKQETETARRVEWAEPALAPEKGGDPRQWGGPAQSSSTRRASILTNAIKKQNSPGIVDCSVIM